MLPAVADQRRDRPLSVHRAIAAAAVAAIIGFSVSCLFFRPQRDAAVTSHAAKPKSAQSDEDAERQRG